VLPRSRGEAEAEAELSAVAAPDTTSVFFCRTSADWMTDFLPTGVTSSAAAGLTHVDHVALSQPFDSFDEAALFYRAVLGLQPEAVTELAAPFGLVRSRAMANPDGSMRITLSSALLRRGEWMPGVPDPQHVAFATDDVFASARALRAAGAPLLTVPGNYYDDLDARLALEPELLARMRDHGVLHDRDEHGEFFHLCTEVLGSRLFFEVVQRIGGYTGCGEANAPVRMAAHRQLGVAAAAPRSPTGRGAPADSSPIMLAGA
jgi:4-hydroxyphenylpyruvate dioxygenase